MVFRLAAVTIGLTPLLLAELTFWALDWGRPTYAEDPFVGFRAVHPLFVLNDEGTRYEIARSRLAFFCPDSFARQKGPNEFRIFCLGGSTVQGRPFARETSLTTWLELSLQAADPQRHWKVVNCGGSSYASYRLVPILKEVLGYQPDLIILYTGHNEFLEDRSYRQIKYLPEVIAWPCEWVLRTRTYRLLRAAYLRLRGRADQALPKDRPTLEAEVDAILEYRGGLEQYHRDQRWRRDVIEHFRYNLHRMVQMARDAGVPLLLANPVCNLRDCPPFKAEHRDGLTPEQLQQWKSLFSRAADGQSTDLAAAVNALEQALAIDDQHAGLHFLLAKCYEAQGKTDQARKSYLQAKELDVCPLRVLEPMNRAVLDVAHQTGTGLVDIRKLFERLIDSGVRTDALLIDHVHPTIAGHQLIADALAEELVRQGIADPVADWKQQKELKYRQHLASLSDAYFTQGIERLETLRCWTMGKADAARPSAEKPATSAEQKYWITDSTGVRHNNSCRYYRNSNGRPCGPNEGRACKICGG